MDKVERLLKGTGIKGRRRQWLIHCNLCNINVNIFVCLLVVIRSGFIISIIFLLFYFIIIIIFIYNATGCLFSRFMWGCVG